MYKRCYPPSFGKTWDGKPLPIVSKEQVQQHASIEEVAEGEVEMV
jgi:hypothetical protein